MRSNNAARATATLVLCALSSMFLSFAAPGASAAPAVPRVAAARSADPSCGDPEAWWDAGQKSCVKWSLGVGTFYTENSGREPLPLPGEQFLELFYNRDYRLSGRGLYWPLGPTKKPASQAHTPWFHNNSFSAGPSFGCWDSRLCAYAHQAPPGWPKGATWQSHQELWTFMQLQLVKVASPPPASTTTTTTAVPATPLSTPVPETSVELVPVGVSVAVPGGDVVPVGGELRPLSLSAKAEARCMLKIYRDGKVSEYGPDQCTKLAASNEMVAMLGTSTNSAMPDVSGLTADMTVTADDGLVECGAVRDATCAYRVEDSASAGSTARRQLVAFRASPPGKMLHVTGTATWKSVSWCVVKVAAHPAGMQGTATKGSCRTSSDMSAQAGRDLTLVGAVSAN